MKIKSRKEGNIVERMRFRLVICRHTQTDDNVRRMYTGQNNVHLNAVGRKQIDGLLKKIAVIRNKIVAVISSDLIRTIDVATRIATKLGLNAVFSSDLREVDVGKMAGMIKDDAVRSYPKEKHRTKNLFFDFKDIGGEDWQNVLTRHNRILDQLVIDFGSGNKDVETLPCVVLVGHGSSFRRVFVDEHKLIQKLHKQGDFDTFLWPPAS